MYLLKLPRLSLWDTRTSVHHTPPSHSLRLGSRHARLPLMLEHLMAFELLRVRHGVPWKLSGLGIVILILLSNHPGVVRNTESFAPSTARLIQKFYIWDPRSARW